MSNSSVQRTNRAEIVKQSLNRASNTVQGWRASKHVSAQATVDPHRLASYYESAVPSRKKSIG